MIEPIHEIKQIEEEDSEFLQVLATREAMEDATTTEHTLSDPKHRWMREHNSGDKSARGKPQPSERE